MGVRMDFCYISCSNISSLSIFGLPCRWHRWQTPFPTCQYNEAHHLAFHQVDHWMVSLRRCTLQLVISCISLLNIQVLPKDSFIVWQTECKTDSGKIGTPLLLHVCPDHLYPSVICTYLPVYTHERMWSQSQSDCRLGQFIDMKSFSTEHTWHNTIYFNK
jgi:hypothetical protein